MESNSAKAVIYLKPKDSNELIKMDRTSARMSELLKAAMEKDSTAKEFPVNVDHDLLIRMSQYLHHHQNQEPTEVDFEDLKKNGSTDWDSEFIQSFAQTRLIDLLKASHYMRIVPLIKLTHSFVVFMTRNIQRKKEKMFTQLYESMSQQINK